MILKNFTYVRQDIFQKYSLYFTLISEAEAEVKHNIIKETVFKEE